MDIPATPTRAIEYLLTDIYHAARTQRVPRPVRKPGTSRTFPTGNAPSAQARAAAAIELDALGRLAQRFIADCPELGITQELLDLALNAEHISEVYMGIAKATGQ